MMSFQSDLKGQSSAGSRCGVCPCGSGEDTRRCPLPCAGASLAHYDSFEQIRKRAFLRRTAAVPGDGVRCGLGPALISMCGDPRRARGREEAQMGRSEVLTGLLCAIGEGRSQDLLLVS